MVQHVAKALTVELESMMAATITASLVRVLRPLALWLWPSTVCQTHQSETYDMRRLNLVSAAEQPHHWSALVMLVVGAREGHPRTLPPVMMVLVRAVRIWTPPRIAGTSVGEVQGAMTECVPAAPPMVEAWMVELVWGQHDWQFHAIFRKGCACTARVGHLLDSQCGSSKEGSG